MGDVFEPISSFEFLDRRVRSFRMRDVRFVNEWSIIIAWKAAVSYDVFT